MEFVLYIIIGLVVLSWIDPMAKKWAEKKELENRLLSDPEFKKNYEYADILLKDLENSLKLIEPK